MLLRKCHEFLEWQVTRKWAEYQTGRAYCYEKPPNDLKRGLTLVSSTDCVASSFRVHHVLLHVQQTFFMRLPTSLSPSPQSCIISSWHNVIIEESWLSCPQDNDGDWSNTCNMYMSWLYFFIMSGTVLSFDTWESGMLFQNDCQCSRVGLPSYCWGSACCNQLLLWTVIKMKLLMASCPQMSFTSGDKNATCLWWPTMTATRLFRKVMGAPKPRTGFKHCYWGRYSFG